MSALNLLASLALAASTSTPVAVTARTSDGWTLSGAYLRAGKPAVVLLHGLDSTKEEWATLQRALAAKGVTTLALDLRGHGKSAKKGATGWRGFGPPPGGEWAGLHLDAAAGLVLLKKRGHAPVGAAGVSLGAVAALETAAKQPDAAFAALFSPALDPRAAAGAVEGLGARRLLLVSSPEDAGPHRASMAVEAARRAGSLPCDRFEAPHGHGAPMFDDPAVLERTVSWFAERTAPSPPKQP